MKWSLLIAEDIRTFSDGKLQLTGLFPDKVVIFKIPPEAPKEFPPGMERLNVMLTVWDLIEGSHTVTARVLDPTGGLVLDFNKPTTVETNKNASSNMIFALTPFIAKTPGTYVLQFLFDDKNITETLEVRFDRGPITAPVDSAVVLATENQAR